MKIKNLLPLIGIIILFYILNNLNFQDIINVFLKINPLFSIISFFAIVPLIIATVIQWKLLLNIQKINVSYLYCLKNIFIGYFYGFITPGGLGAYTRALYLKNESESPLPKCISNILIMNTIDFLALLFLGIIASIILIRWFQYIFIIILFIFSIVIILFFYFLKKDRSIILFKKIIQTRVFKILENKIVVSLNSFYDDIPNFKEILLPFTISTSSWIIKYYEFFLISILFSIKIPILFFFCVMIIADIIASIPISIYGIGTREAMLISMFSIFSITQEKIVSMSLFWFIIIWLTPSIIGAIITIFETKKFNRIS
jgi:uncharacterized protein (TIRG00374 family)